MKRTFLFLLWAWFCVAVQWTVTYSQSSPVISPELQAHLSQVSDTTLVRILIVFKNSRTWSPAELHSLDQMSLEARQNYVVAELKAFVQREHTNVLNFLRSAKAVNQAKAITTRINSSRLGYGE